jgi:uncharacterized protein (TIGR00255 family)
MSVASKGDRIRGMTGYGTGSAEAAGVRVDVEIRGGNNRFLDARVKLPAEVAALEAELRQGLVARVARGRVDATVTLAAGRAERVRLEVRRGLVQAYLDVARDLRRRHRLKGTLAVDQVLALPGVVQVLPESGAAVEAAAEATRAAFTAAVEAFDAMRADEGRRIRIDLLERVGAIAADTAAIAEAAAREPALAAGRLRARVESLLEGEQRIDAGRLAQEVALLADRVDISEEVVRLNGYVEQARGLLASPPGPLGKLLDFVMQEMNRESNTIASKSEALPICQAALRIRSAVEAIREQVQNLE